MINRTFDGYQTEIKTIYGKLQRDLGVKIEPAPEMNGIGYIMWIFILKSIINTSDYK